jgi:hypothetical protein
MDLERTPAALAELGRLYAWVEQVAAADPAANVPDSARVQCERVVADHVGRNATALAPQAAVGPGVARVRAQVAIALFDLLPDAPTRRIDAADALALTGARRAMLVERGVLALDAGTADDHIAALRALFDRLPALRDKVEAVVVGGDADTLKGRSGVVTTPVDPGGNAGPILLWGGEVRSPPGDGWTTAVARGLATASVARTIDRLESAHDAIAYAGGPPAIAATTAMLILNGPLAIDVAATRLLSRGKESAASLAGAIALLADSLTPVGKPPAADLKIPVGPSRPTGLAPQVTELTLSGDGTAFRFRLDGHTWQFGHDDHGNVSGMRRDGAPITKAMLAAARPTTGS